MKSWIKKIAKQCDVYPKKGKKYGLDIVISKEDFQNIVQSCKRTDYAWDGECEQPYTKGYDLDRMIKTLKAVQRQVRDQQN